jgi:hypothetical protein
MEYNIEKNVKFTTSDLLNSLSVLCSKPLCSSLPDKSSKVTIIFFPVTVKTVNIKPDIISFYFPSGNKTWVKETHTHIGDILTDKNCNRCEHFSTFHAISSSTFPSLQICYQAHEDLHQNKVNNTSQL